MLVVLTPEQALKSTLEEFKELKKYDLITIYDDMDFKKRVGLVVEIDRKKMCFTYVLLGKKVLDAIITAPLLDLEDWLTKHNINIPKTTNDKCVHWSIIENNQ